MSKPQLLALWPCHSWEDFPDRLSEPAAASLLACWTVLWHPTLIGRLESTPGFWRADRIAEIPAGSCVSVPDFSHAKIDKTGWENLRSVSAAVVSGNQRRELLAQLGIEAEPGEEAGFVGDFFALGFCWIQLHLMTRQIRYAGSLDEGIFQESLVGASAAFNTDPQSRDVQARLQKCFDLLLEERNRFYPSDANIYRIVIARPVLDCKLLLDELAGDCPVNILATVADLLELGASAPEVLTRMREKKASGQLAIVSAGNLELPTLQCHSTSAIRNLSGGIQGITSLLGSGIEVFARRSSGLSPIDPEIASNFGCRLALHSVFDADPAPDMSAPNALWQSPGGESIPVIAGKPLDASRADSLLRLGFAIGEMIDSWHYAHILVGYWPGHQSDYFRDLLRSMRYGNLMGRFRLLSKAAETLATQTWGETIEADDYDYCQALNPREPALRLATALRNYWRQTLECLNLKKSAALLSLVDADFKNRVPQLEALGSRIDKALGKQNGDNASDAIDIALATIRNGFVTTKAPQVLIHASNQSAVLGVSVPLGPAGNQESQSLGDFESANKSSSLWLAHQANEGTSWMIRAPAAGCVGLGLDLNSGLLPSKSSRHPRMVDGCRLRNEFLSVEVNPKTGGIAAFQRAGQRGSITSQRLAIRMSKSEQGESSQKYATMEADSVEFQETGRISAICIARGRLVWQDRTLASFEQRVSLSRGHSFVVLEISVVPQVSFRGGLWSSGACSRLAWTDEMSKRFRYLQETRTRCCREFFSSPLCTEIESGDDRISLFTGGNIWHRQSALNIMDTLLPESIQENNVKPYRLGIGLDVVNPLETAIGLLTGPVVVSRCETFPENDFRILGWSKSTLHWYDVEQLADADANRSGFSIRFRESQGKAGKLSIRFAQLPQQVELQDFAGKRVGTPQVVDGRIEFAYRAWQYLALAVYWNQ